MDQVFLSSPDVKQLYLRTEVTSIRLVAFQSSDAPRLLSALRDQYRSIADLHLLESELKRDRKTNTQTDRVFDLCSQPN